MPLQAILEAAEFDALPDTTVIGKDSFVKNEKENKFFLNLPDSEAAKLAFNLQASVTKLTENNKELLKQKGEANKAKEAYEAIGMSPEEIAEAINSKRPEEFQAILKTKETDYEARIKSASDETAKEREAREAAEQRLADTLLDVTVERLITDHDLKPSARFALKDSIRIERDESGEFIKRVYENGEPAYHGPDPMKPDQLVTKWREGKVYTELFNAGDGGGTGGTNRQTGNGSKQYEGLMPVERLNLAREQGVKTP